MAYKILKNEMMSAYTTFKVGGPADTYIIPESIEQLKEALRNYTEIGDKPLVIGNGSNLLVSDLGIRGTVIEIGDGLSGIEFDGENVYAEAGVKLSRLAKQAYEHSLSGVEFASGIPGTLGGAVFMNAGAYGGEMKDVVSYVDVIKDDEIVRIEGTDMNFSYRYSRAMNEDMVIIGVGLKLHEGNGADILAAMNDFNQRRRDKQPLEFPSAGSTFKRPEGYFAGKLIMDSGLAGESVGGAMVSPKHCGFIINSGSATADDIYRLIRHVQEVVREKFGVDLEPEVRLIGEFGKD